MKKRWIVFGLLIGFALILRACCLWIASTMPKKEKTASCHPLPKEISENDLVGTWMAGRLGHSDKMIIQADGTYKQVVHVDFFDRPAINYESGWQPWYLSKSEEDFTYLHLEGLRFCGMNTTISCDKRDGGGYDYCRNEYVEMFNEGILIVFTSSNELSYFINLNFQRESQLDWVYYLQKPY